MENSCTPGLDKGPIITRTRAASASASATSITSEHAGQAISCLPRKSFGPDPCICGNPTSTLPSLGSSYGAILACKLHCAWARWNEGGALTKTFPRDFVPLQNQGLGLVSSPGHPLPSLFPKSESWADQCNAMLCNTTLTVQGVFSSLLLPQKRHGQLTSPLPGFLLRDAWHRPINWMPADMEFKITAEPPLAGLDRCARPVPA